MAIPWQPHTRKEIAGITHRKRKRAGHSFVPPTPQTRVDFSHAQLCASMAMTNALSGLSAAAASSLARAMSQLVTDQVDDQKPLHLQFQPSVAQLADNARTFFSSCIATGVADQYALALGYRFRCNSRELIRKGKAGDFLYDGPPVPTNSAVMIESKGSLRERFGVGTFQKTVNDGYTEQVRPHVGKSYPQPDGQVIEIVHGYAIGCAAKIPLKNAIGHVVETAPKGARAHPKKGEASRHPAPDSASPTNAQIALGNYSGVAMLIGDEALQRHIDDARQGKRLERYSRSEGFRLIDWRGQRFVAFVPRLASDPQPRFAIWEPIYRALINSLRELPAAWRIPVVPADLMSGNREDGGAVLPDGFALLPPSLGREEKARLAPRAVPPTSIQEEVARLGEMARHLFNSPLPEREREELIQKALNQLTELKFTR